MSEQPTTNRLFQQNERVQLMLSLTRVVRATGEHVLDMGPEQIFDTVEVARHQFSTVDAAAGNALRAAMVKDLHDFPGTVLEESEIPRMLSDPARLRYPLIICDAVEGATNAKRGLAARIRRPILAGTLAMVIESERLTTIAASAFYDFATQKVFASVRTEQGAFLGFHDDHIIPVENVRTARGDSHVYAIVPGYSHGNIQERAAVESALLSIGIESAGGTRSSAQDLLQLLGNQADAYVDLRAIFPGSTESRDEVLHSWDVGGLLPVLDAAGFTITDAFGRGWQELRFADRLSLVVSRPEHHVHIREALRGVPCLQQHSVSLEQPIVPFPQQHLG